LSHLLTSGSSSAFALIPEHVLADATSWLAFVIQGGHAEMLAALDVGTTRGKGITGIAKS
jgi:hypothetical protein